MCFEFFGVWFLIVVWKVFYLNRFMRVFLNEVKLNCVIGLVIVFWFDGMLYGVLLVIGILGGVYGNVYYRCFWGVSFYDDILF